MRDLSDWSISLGTWAGVRVRIHALFLLLAVLVLVGAKGGDLESYLWYAGLLAVLFLATALHEVARCLAAWRLGALTSRVVLWPFGGLTSPVGPADVRSEVTIAVSGSLVNLGAASLAASALLLLGRSPGEIFHPAPPYTLEGFSAVVALRMILWVNLWVLFAVNLLPASPMDAGRALNAALCGTLGPGVGGKAAAWVTQFVGLGLCLVAWLLPRGEMEFFAYAWLAAALLGVFLFFTGRLELAQAHADSLAWPEDDELDLGMFDDETPGEEARVDASGSPGWLEAHQEERQRRRREREAEEDRRVDEILARLHERGLDGLTDEERALLDRASARYRSRGRREA